MHSDCALLHSEAPQALKLGALTCHQILPQGAIGSGTGILLAVTIIYQYFEVRHS